MKRPKTIHVLVGLKGAGKTHLCRQLQERFALGFIPVEDIWLTLKNEKTHQGSAFDEEGQQRVINAILAAHEDEVVIESTGTAPWFHEFLGKLKAVGAVRLIRIDAPPSVCLERVRSRNQEAHIPIADDRVKEINALAEKVVLPWDMTFDNSTAGCQDFLSEFRRKFLS